MDNSARKMPKSRPISTEKLPRKSSSPPMVMVIVTKGCMHSEPLRSLFQKHSSASLDQTQFWCNKQYALDDHSQEKKKKKKKTTESHTRIRSKSPTKNKPAKVIVTKPSVNIPHSKENGKSALRLQHSFIRNLMEEGKVVPGNGTSPDLPMSDKVPYTASLYLPRFVMMMNENSEANMSSAPSSSAQECTIFPTPAVHCKNGDLRKVKETVTHKISNQSNVSSHSNQSNTSNYSGNGQNSTLNGNTVARSPSTRLRNLPPTSNSPRRVIVTKPPIKIRAKL